MYVLKKLIYYIEKYINFFIKKMYIWSILNDK